MSRASSLVILLLSSSFVLPCGRRVEIQVSRKICSQPLVFSFSKLICLFIYFCVLGLFHPHWLRNLFAVRLIEWQKKPSYKLELAADIGRDTRTSLPSDSDELCVMRNLSSEYSNMLFRIETTVRKPCCLSLYVVLLSLQALAFRSGCVQKE